MRSLLLAIVITLAPAADLPDPWQASAPQQAITTLISLRTPLDARPNDQDLLGRAIMLYVNLALGGKSELDGACGPWLEYARELATRRAKARRGEPATLAAAAPELWVRLLDGDASGTVAALERWKAEREHPLYRALRARATRDVRPFRDRAPTTAHEKYADLVAAVEANVPDHKSEQGIPPFDPLLMRYLHLYAKDSQADVRPSFNAVYADVAWMLNSPELDDTTAGDAARALLAGCDAPIPARADRAALVRLAIAAANRLPDPHHHPAALAAAVAAARAVVGGPRGVMDGKKHRLVGLGDIAAWNRDRLYLVGWMHVFWYFDDEFYKSQLVTPLRTLMPGSLIVARIAAWQEVEPNEAHGEPLAEALGREIRDPAGISPGLLAKPFLCLARKSPHRAAALVEELLAARAKRRVQAHVCLEDLAEACHLIGMDHLVAADVRESMKRDPWKTGLLKEWRRADHTRRMLRNLPAPAATMTHPLVDFRALPFPGIAPQTNFALRWRGWLRSDTAGTYLIATESDDGTRLQVGDTVVDNGGQHGMRVRSSRVELTAGWQPLEMEFYQGDGGAGCRLLWQPPGAPKLVPIPAAALAHGDDHQPGLTAELFTPTGEISTLIGPDARELANAEAKPWLARVQIELADRLMKCDRHDEAVVAYDRVLAMRELDIDERPQFIFALLAQSKPDGARATRLLWHPKGLRASDSVLNFIELRLCQLGLQEAALATMPAGHQADLYTSSIQARIAFDCADFTTAAAAWSRLFAHPGLKSHHPQRLEKAMIDRIGQGTDLHKLIAFYTRHHGEPCYQISARWLDGELPWDTALAQAAQVKWGDTLVYTRALYRLTIGEHDGARSDLAEVAAKHPERTERHTCDALLRWYARQTPETLAARPRAPAIVARTAPLPADKPADKPAAAGSDF